MAKPRKSSSGRPCILIIDDSGDQARSRALSLKDEAETIARTPDELTLDDVKRADVILIDLILDDWKIDPGIPISQRPKDGVALGAVLRSHFSQKTRKAFALHSAQLVEISGGLVPTEHLHALARANNLEWVFSKVSAQNQRNVDEQVLSLACSLRSLPENWPLSNPSQMRKAVESTLRVPRKAWAKQAWNDIERCHPPIHQLSPPTQAMSLIRWMLWFILPYSTFLWDYRYLAARLHVTPTSLKDALKRDKSLSQKLLPFRYSGILHDFLDDRWWQAGIEHMLWTNSKARPFDLDFLRKNATRLSRKLEPYDGSEPVVVFNSDLRPEDDLATLSSAVEIRPDDWPSYAARPWARRDLIATDAKLKSLAIGI